ncbi:MAG: alpha-amylase family glycosyl hydrolase, partial [Candidatus Promineifilaceae bacterium]
RAEFNVPAGDFNYKMALNDTWDVSFPADNKPLSLGAAADVRFYYDDKSNAVLDSVNDQIAVAAGSFQNALGCGGDWQPECVNTLLTDVDGDGIYTFSATGLPAGSYEFKVALDEAWDVSYPADNVPVTINADSELLTISWDSVTTGVSVDVSSGEPAVDWVVAGDFQDALTGSACGNWNNSCAETTMEDDDGDGVFRLIADALPAGGYEYKIVEFNNWDNAFPADNVAFTADGSQMRWYFQPGPNNVADNANQCIATVAGDFQDELGGPEWSPSNLRTMMWQEAPGSDWYAFSATLPAGSWQYKVALDEDWAESYPADNVALELGAETAVTIRYNCASNAIEQVLGGEVPDEIAALVTDPARNPIEDDVFYFVMPDRFSNGDPSNDTGGIPGDRLQNGFDPTDMGFFHGGDLAGLTAKLDYMKEMGTTAIWMTPVFKNNPVQGEGADVSAGYHGYWYLDMTEFDPHFGTNNELTTLIDEAHARDIKVFFDIITNHTADIVSYEEGTYGYRDKETYPYRDADGVAFDDRDYVGTGTFPELDAATSFPYTPVFLDPSGETAKVPAWLNNPIYYHNRGNSTFSGENSLYGDFYGLDDLFTEHPDVVNGMTQIYKDWITGYDIDGFRVDTVKHVNLEFWQEFMPQILAHAEAVGRADFFVFGEVFSGNPELLSHYTSQADFPAVLDFNFQERVRSYASAGGSSDVLRDLFADDDYYTDADSNAYALPTFIGNHDRGRFGWFLNADNGGSLSDEEMVARSELATATMFFARGVPVIYYGDEQGFTGTGGDKEARQDMFPSQVAHYMAEDQIGTDATPADDNFDSTHPLYQAYAEMAQVVAANPALQTGAQLHRYSQDSPGIYAFSRIDPDQALEYLVVLNNSTAPQTAVFKTEGANITYNEIYPGSERVVTSDDFKEITVDAPGVSISVFKAESAYAPSESAPGVSFNTLASGQQVEIGSQNLDGNDVQDRIEVGVALSNEQYAEVTFAVRKSGTEPYTVIGVDDNAPYRVFFSLSDVPGGFVEGDMLDFVAVAKDSGGNLSYAEVTGITPIFSEAPQPGAVTHAIIHYFREDGDYGDHTTGDYNDYWGLHLWGDITETIEWTAPKPFLGEDEYGRFAWVNLTPNATNVGVIAHRGDTKDPLNAPDRFFNPSVSPEIWLKQDDLTIYTSQAAAQGYVTIRYHRDDGDYGTPSSDYTTYWGLHLWGSALADGVGTDWTSPRPFDGIDDFGAFWQVPIQNAAGDFNFIIHRGDAKDPGPDQALNPQEMPSAWIMSGDETIYPQRGAAEGFITLHYHRPAGDYGDYASTNYADFWGLHTWGDADDPGWTTPRKPAFTDTFGPAFQVPLINAMQEIGYILHRGDT